MLTDRLPTKNVNISTANLRVSTNKQKFRGKKFYNKFRGPVRSE